MQKYEKEIKILDINVEEVEKQLEKIASLHSQTEQQRIEIKDVSHG